MYSQIFRLSLCGLALTTLLSASDRTDRTIILDAVGVQNLGIQTDWVDERDFKRSVFAIGRIEEIPSNHSVLSSRVAGRVIDIHAYEGDHVAAGDEVAVIETRQLGDPPPTVTLKAPQGGLVTRSHIRLGQPVEPDAELMDFSDRSKVWAVAKIPEQAAADVSVDTLAHIRIPALDQVVDAKVIRFGVTADRDSGTVEAIFELDNADGRLRPGLRAEFSVITGGKSAVLAVPRESIQGDPSARVVFVKDFNLDNAYVRVPVVLGERNDQYVEVLQGLFPGDEVVTKGAYSLMFAGGGQQMSLKEALDAAHGHEHNEDGSEITPEQKAKREAGHDHDDHDHGHSDEAHDHEHGSSMWLWIYSIFMTVFSVLLLQQVMRRNASNREEV